MDFDTIDEKNEKLNSQNEWHKQLKQYLLQGKHLKGATAVRNKKRGKFPKQINETQARAIRR